MYTPLVLVWMRDSSVVVHSLVQTLRILWSRLFPLRIFGPQDFSLHRRIESTANQPRRTPSVNLSIRTVRTLRLTELYVRETWLDRSPKFLRHCLCSEICSGQLRGHRESAQLLSELSRSRELRDCLLRAKMLRRCGW